MINQMTNMQQRLFSGFIAAILTLMLIFFSQAPAFKVISTLLIALIIAVAIWEFYQIAYAKNFYPAAKLGITTSVLYTISVGLSTQYPIFHLLPDIVLLASLIAFFLYYFIKGQEPFLNLATTIFSFVYLAIPLSCLVSITYYFSQSGAQDGRWWIAYLLITTKITDTGAFLIGKRFGKQKLAPFISPQKTWEGALGGLIFALVTSILITLTASLVGGAFSLTFVQSIWLGAGIGILGQCGDLSESLLKRDGGIKDSNQLPGLGGMLDMVDSLVFTTPLVYIFLKAYT